MGGQDFSGWDDAATVDLRVERSGVVERVVGVDQQERHCGWLLDKRRALGAEGDAHADEQFLLGAG